MLQFKTLYDSEQKFYFKKEVHMKFTAHIFCSSLNKKINFKKVLLKRRFTVKSSLLIYSAVHYYVTLDKNLNILKKVH